MAGCRVAILSLAFFAGFVRCADKTSQNNPYPTWTCYYKEIEFCEEGAVRDKVGTTWMVKMDDVILTYGEKHHFVALSNVAKNIAAGHCQTKNVNLFTNANTGAAILEHRGVCYVLDKCVQPKSFRTPTDTARTYNETYIKEILPFINELKEHKGEGFDMVEVLTHLAKHGTVKGAPTLRRDVGEKLQKYFKEQFDEISKAYKAGTISVNDFGGAFYNLVTGDDDQYEKLADFVSSLQLNKLDVEADVANFLYDTTAAQQFGAFEEYSVLYSFVIDVYATREEGVAAYKRGDFTIRTAKVVQKGKDYTISFAKDAKSGNFVVKIECGDGTVDTYITYYPKQQVWAFHCRLTGYVLVYLKGPNYALFNGRAGVGIVVCKSTNSATIVKSPNVKEHYNLNHVYIAINAMAETTRATKVTTSSRYCFNFKHFITNAHLQGSVLLMPGGVQAKLQLNRFFKVYVKNMRFVDGYEYNDCTANAVLFFFKQVKVKAVKDDYRRMVKAVGVRDSRFHCGGVLAATFTCTFENYKLLPGYKGSSQ